MTVIVLMVVQICCSYIPTSTFDSHQEGVHFCPPVVSFFCMQSQMSLSFYPCNAVGILDLQSFLVLLLVEIASVSVPLILCCGFQKWEETGKQIVWTLGKAKFATPSHALSSGVMLALSLSPALLTAWCVCIKLYGRATLSENSKECLSCGESFFGWLNIAA